MDYQLRKSLIGTAHSKAATPPMPVRLETKLDDISKDSASETATHDVNAGALQNWVATQIDDTMTGETQKDEPAMHQSAVWLTVPFSSLIEIPSSDKVDDGNSS